MDVFLELTPLQFVLRLLVQVGLLMPRPSLRQQGVPVELLVVPLEELEVPLGELVDEPVVEDVPPPNLVLRDFRGLVEENGFCVFFFFLVELRFGFASCKAKGRGR